MKKLINRSRVIGGAALLLFAAACATSTQSTENLLASAGFQQRTADTAEKQEVLNTLPKNQLTHVTWKGQDYYVQPDATAANTAWVGRAAEYQSYQQLRHAKQMSNDNLLAAEMNSKAMKNWGNVWGPNLAGRRWH